MNSKPFKPHFTP